MFTADIKIFNKTSQILLILIDPNLLNDTSNERYLNIFQKTSKIRHLNS